MHACMSEFNLCVYIYIYEHIALDLGSCIYRVRVQGTRIEHGLHLHLVGFPVFGRLPSC